MNSGSLTQEQATALYERLSPSQQYLNKLVHRMQNKGLPLDDPLWLSTRIAQQAMRQLCNELGQTCEQIQLGHGWNGR